MGRIAVDLNYAVSAVCHTKCHRVENTIANHQPDTFTIGL